MVSVPPRCSPEFLQSLEDTRITAVIAHFQDIGVNPEIQVGEEGENTLGRGTIEVTHLRGINRVDGYADCHSPSMTDFKIGQLLQLVRGPNVQKSSGLTDPISKGSPELAMWATWSSAHR